MTSGAGWVRLLSRCLIAIAACYALVAVIVLTAAEMLVPSAATSAPADGPREQGPAAIVVFYHDDPELRRARVAKGVELMAADPGATLVLVGGSRPHRGSYLGAAVMRAMAIAQGVAPERITIDRGSNDSWSNIEGALAATAAGNPPPKRMLFVSDRLHLPRLALIARMQGVSGQIELAPVSEALGARAYAGRVHHEVLAVGALALPRSWVASYMQTTRTD